MKRVGGLLCAVLVTAAITPMPAYADVIFPGPNEEAQTKDGSGCSNAAAAAHAGPEARDNAYLAAAVGSLSVAATTGIVYFADKRPE